MNKFLSLAAIAAFVAATVFFPSLLLADNTTELRDRLHAAAAASTLDSGEIKPWHLLISFHLSDAKGGTLESGTIEEWWAAPNLHKTVYISPSFSNTEIRNEQGLYQLSPDLYPPEALTLVLDQVVHPVAYEDEVNTSKPDLRKETWSKVPIDCIMLDQKIANLAYPPLGLFPTFCFDRGSSSLRASFSSGSVLVIRNRVGQFQGKSVAIDQAIIIDTTPVATAHLEKLSGSTFSSKDFLPSAEMTLIDEHPTQVPGSVVAGSAIKKINPIYPDRAKANHSSGTVVLHAVIGTDGRIHSLSLISTPDPDLALASFMAVRRWTYEPYLLNGRRTMVDTTITVNFKFGPG